MIVKKSRIVFILIYGLFLGFVLSFLYAGPLFNRMDQIENLKNIFLLIIFVSGIISCLITYKFKIKLTQKKLSIIMTANVFFSIVFYFVAQYKISIISIGIACICAFFIGFSAMFISNTILSASKKYNKYEEIFINVAMVMLIANIICYIVYILLSFNLNNIGLMVTIFSGIFSVFLSTKINFENDTNYHKLFYLSNKDLYILGYIFFLLKISEGILYIVVEYQLALQQNHYEYIYIFPYILALLTAFYISYKTKRQLFSMLSTSISFIGIGLLLLLISNDNVVLSHFFMNFGFGLLDIIIWGSIIYLIYVYDNSYRIASFIMFFQMLGVLVGGLISEIDFFETDLVYIVSIVCIFVSIILVPKASEIIINEIDSKKKILDEEKDKIERLQSKKKYHLLSKREKEVVNLIILGKINRDIAKEMNISETTVKTHCKNIYIKLSVKTKKELKIVFKEN